MPGTATRKLLPLTSALPFFMPGWLTETAKLFQAMPNVSRLAPIDEKTLIYVAGFFDGEGSIIIRRVKNKLSPAHKLVVELANTDLDLIHLLKDSFGGQVHQRKPRSPKHNRCDIWVIQCQQAAVFLRQILPYLRSKRRQAEIAIALEYRLQAVNWRGKLLPHSEIAERDRMWQEIRNLNQKKSLQPQEIIANEAKQLCLLELK